MWCDFKIDNSRLSTCSHYGILDLKQSHDCWVCPSFLVSKCMQTKLQQWSNSSTIMMCDSEHSLPKLTLMLSEFLEAVSRGGFTREQICSCDSRKLPYPISQTPDFGSSTDKVSSSWIGDRWEDGILLRLASAPHRLTQSRPDDSLSLAQTHTLVAVMLRLAPNPSASLGSTQVHSVSLRFTQICSDPPSLTEITVWFRFAQSPSD